MAFLLSPKTGGGASQSYLFFSGENPVSINGGDAAAYGEKNPANINSGDVLTWLSDLQAAISYEKEADGSILKVTQTVSPYTVEAVPDADNVYWSMG